MAIYGGFSTAMLGMMSQAAALDNIGTNVANVNTGGFKRTDTSFSTVLSNSIGPLSDVGGVRTIDTSTITQQGNIVSSEFATDVAIAGKGFFVLNSQQDASGEKLFTRDGSLEVVTVNDISVTGIGGASVTTKDGYLADKNGYFVQGWAYTGQTVSTTATPTSLRIDQYAFTDTFEPTTAATLGLNLPASDAIGKVRQYDISLTDSLGASQTAQLNFTKSGINAWNVTNTTSQAAVSQVNTVTLAGSTGAAEVGDTYTVTINSVNKTYTTLGTEANIDAVRDALITQINTDASINSAVTAAAGASGEITLTADTAGTTFTTTVAATNGGTLGDGTAAVATTTANVASTVTSSATALTFNANGVLTTPTSLSLALSFATGSTASVALDISPMTQYASSGDDLNVSYTKDGFAKANMKSFSFDEAGNIVGVFDDSTYRKVYKLALGVFANPDGLDAKNGNVYAISPESGDVTITSADGNGYASFSPNSRELSNVDIAKEFTRMMVTQTAYNASSTVFKTVDELITVARDLKR